MGNQRRGHSISHEDYLIKEGQMRSSSIPNFTTPEKFIKAKIKMLKEDFMIDITKEDEEYLRKFKTEGGINSAVKHLINKYWR